MIDRLALRSASRDRAMVFERCHMTISPTTGYCALPIDRTFGGNSKKGIDRISTQKSPSPAGDEVPQAGSPVDAAPGGTCVLPADGGFGSGSKKNIDLISTQTSLSPDGAASPQAVAQSRSGGLLSSVNIAEVLKLADTPSVDVSTLKEPLGNSDLLGDVIKRSKEAYAAAGKAATNSLADSVTQKDVDTIRANKGYNAVLLNDLTTVADDDGNPPPDDIGGQIQKVTGNVAADRIGGRLSGELTPDYLKEIFGKYGKGDEPLPKDWLDKALAHPGAATDTKPTDV